MSPDNGSRPRVGIPWRTSAEEAENNRSKMRNYEDAVAKAGGEPVILSLKTPVELERILPSLDAFVLPGSSADVDPAQYGTVNTGASEPADHPREQADHAILKHALSGKKPVLAICYECQLLNVHQGGTLIQDLRADTHTALAHRKKDLQPEPQQDPVHEASFEAGSRLAEMAGEPQTRVNSSHHQAIEKAGQNLRVTAQAPDGTIEGVEWTGDGNWVIGVQWHPERMAGDKLSERLFAEFVAAARGMPHGVALKV